MSITAQIAARRKAKAEKDGESKKRATEETESFGLSAEEIRLSMKAKEGVKRRCTLQNIGTPTTLTRGKDFNVTLDDLITRLRVLGAPIVVFGEDFDTRKARLYQLELFMVDTDKVDMKNQAFMEGVNARRANTEKTGSQEGLAKLDVIWEDELDAWDFALPEVPPKVIKPVIVKGDVGASTKTVSNIKLHPKEAAEKRRFAELTGDVEVDENELANLKWEAWRVRKWLIEGIKSWAEDLNKRPEEEKRTVQGMMKSALCKQSRINLKPLHEHLIAGTLNKQLLKKIHQITDDTLSGRYMDAHDQFLAAAIGNAPWPMGVTMVGIHERAGRSKINTGQIAHILNDDCTRKFIQCVKRLITYWQIKHPIDPSQMVTMSDNNIL